MSSPNAASPKRRYLALRLPYLATDRIARVEARGTPRWPGDRRRAEAATAAGHPHPSLAASDRAGAPLATVERAANTLRLARLNRSAERLGLSPGLPLADARARFPSLSVVDADPTADARLLSDLADRSLRWTPFVGLWPPDGLMLDITGAAHLFGGEAALLADVVDRFEAHGFDATAAIGDTPGAAAALALCGRSAIVPPDATAEALRPLPVAALRIPSETTAALRRVGIARIDDLMALPRAPLAARFGASLLTRLDQALGTLAEAIAPRVPVPSHVAERRLAEPITRAEDVATVIAVLARDISGRLEARGEGARRLTLALWHTDGRIARVEVGTGSPVRNPERLARLFREKLEGDGCELETGGGYDLMRLAVTLAEPLDPEAPTLDAGARPDPGAVAALADQLGARFGADRLRRAVLVDSHVPERAALLLAGAARPSPPQARVGLEQDSRGALRPIRLLVPPEPVETIAAVPDGPPMQFRWRRVAHRVVRSEGPERIAMEWWRTGDATPPTRDYFRVEDQQGRRFWLYREGLYGRETETPRWFVHGLFA